jgi:hypothetical protein
MEFCTQTINIAPKKSGMKYFMLTTENMATVRNVEVISDKFNVVRIS